MRASLFDYQSVCHCSKTVYLVTILGIDESLFWDADFAFLWDVAKSKVAFDAWLMGERERRR